MQGESSLPGYRLPTLASITSPLSRLVQTNRSCTMPAEVWHHA
jgi:hypothetical protein